MSEGQIDSELLTSWVDEVRRLAKEEDRSEIGDEFIGHLFAYAPQDADGAWPHRTIRDTLERLASKELELGIEIERFNMRGVQVRAMYGGGAPERTLAEEARQSARMTRTWPRTNAVLERIADSWDKTAEREDERARQDKLRDV